MARVGSFNRDVGVGLVLGVVALVLNFSSGFVTPHNLRVGDLFLFLACSSLGLRAGLVAAAIGLMPEAFQAGQYLHFVRLLTLCTALGFTAERFPQVPPFIVSTALWTAVFAPFFYIVSNTHPALLSGAGSLAHTPGDVVLLAVQENLLVLVSGALLLNATIWGLLTTRPRRVRLDGLLVHTVTLVATILTFASMELFDASDSYLRTHPHGWWALGMLTLATMVLPALAAWRVSKLIEKRAQELVTPLSLGQSANKTFSGLASEYWRRKNTSDSEAERNNSSGEIATMGSIPSPLRDGGEDSASQLKLSGVCALTRDGTITFVNRKFARYAEIKSQDVIGKRLDAVGMNPAMCNHIRQLLETTFSKGPRTTELKVNQLPNKLRFFEIRSLLSDAIESATLSNGPDSVIIAVRDITDRRTVESRLLQAQKIDSLGNLVNAVAHSFNNALSYIIGQASTARVMASNEMTNPFLDEILKSAEHAGADVKQLLEFASDKPGHMAPADMCGLLANHMELLRRMIGPEFEVIFNRPPEALGAVCNSPLFLQAVSNLVLNARESYGDSFGKIEISVGEEVIDEDVACLHVGSRPGKFVRVRVRDWGCGMTAEHLGRAFDPLFTTKSSKGNPGLGLSIVLAVTRAHDGFLTAESRPDRGTTISLYLPERPPHEISEPAETVQRDTPHPLSQGCQEQILVVEDDDLLRELVVRMLSTLGYRAQGCGSGEEALERTKTNSFDLILADLLMPRMNGMELIKRLRADRPDLKTIIMSGYGATHPIARKLDDGKILAKPFDIETLAQTVRATLEGDVDIPQRAIS